MIAPALLGLQLTAPQLALPQFEAWAQVAIERALNSLPEGLLIALFAWAVLRVLPKQNSRTRFAVWFLALLSVVGIPVLDGFGFSGLTFGALSAASILGAASQSSKGASSAIALPAHWAPFIFLIWLVAACAAMTRLAASLWHLRNLRQSCARVDAAAIDPSLRKTLEELNAAKSLTSRPVTLATSERVRVPAALGLWKPMIVLPAWALHALPPSDLSIILRHEFAHLRRWDDWTNLLQKMVRALFFFHPAVWWIEGRLSVEREMACDDVVVAQTGNPMGYASCLVSLLERSLAERGWTMAQAIVHRAREASERLSRILDKNRPAATGISKPALGLVGTFAVLCVAMLPQTPQFVAFDHGPLSAPPDHGYSAALAEPPILRPSMIHKANLQTPTPPQSRPEGLSGNRPKGSSGNKPEGSSGNRPKGSPENRPEGSSGNRPGGSPENRPGGSPENSPALQRREKLQRRSSPGGTAEVLAHTLPPADRAALAAANASESLKEVSAAAENQPVMHTLVFVETMQFVTTQNVGSDWAITNSTITSSAPAATLWRIQVWRVMFVSPAWERPSRVPVANKT